MTMASQPLSNQQEAGQPFWLEAVEQFGSPVYVYDEGKLASDYFSLRDALPKDVTLYYSMKVNPNPEVCRLVNGWGSPIEVASVGEYEIARSNGVNLNSIVFTGPGKSADEIHHVLRHGIYAINAESIPELFVIHDEAVALGIAAPVMLRVNLSIGAKGSRMSSVGLASQFGIDDSEINEAVHTAINLEGLKLIGLHTYQGTQNFHLDFYRESVPMMFGLTRQVRNQFGLQLRCLGLGGGFGVPMFEGDEPFPVEAFGAYLAGELERNRDLELKMVFVESGRRIAATMGIYAVRVLYTKLSKGKAFAIVDGGTHHRAFSSLMGRSFKQSLPLQLWKAGERKLYESGEGEGRISYNVCGKLCTPADVLQGSVMLPLLEPGDWIAFPHLGAYGLTCGNVHFLSHALPKEVMLRPDGTLNDVSWLST